ncbi:hypothetical protein MPER_08173, partial [Moniliophthora perniciosa FA553]
FLGFAALSGISINSWIKSGGLGGGLGRSGGRTGTAVTLNASTVYLLLLVTAAALLLSTTYLMLTRAFTRQIMHITLILSILLNIGICVYYWITKYYSGAIIFTVIAILSVLSYWGYRSRIPLASLLLPSSDGCFKTPQECLCRSLYLPHSSGASQCRIISLKS